MRIAISVLLCMFLSFGALGQNVETTVVESDTTGFTSFSDNFYFEVDGGTQLLFSEDAGNLSFKERLTPSFSLSFGTWFSQVWGAKLKILGCSLNGFSTTDGIYTYRMASVRYENGAEATSSWCTGVSARADRIAPHAPTALEPSVVAEGVAVTWKAPSAAPLQSIG